MPRMGGIEAARLIHRRYPAVKIIVLTSFQNPELTHAALQAGASGFLLKDAAEEDLVAAIRLAHAGHLLIPPGANPPAEATESSSARPMISATATRNPVLGGGWSDQQGDCPSFVAKPLHGQIPHQQRHYQTGRLQPHRSDGGCPAAWTDYQAVTSARFPLVSATELVK